MKSPFYKLIIAGSLVTPWLAMQPVHAQNTPAAPLEVPPPLRTTTPQNSPKGATQPNTATPATTVPSTTGAGAASGAGNATTGIPGNDTSNIQAITDAFNEGVAALQGGNMVSAAEHFEKTIALAPNEATFQAMAHMWLGYVRLRQERLDEALTALQTAEKLSGTMDARYQAIIQNNIGMAYWNQKQYALAQPAYQRAVTIDPTYTDARYNLAFAYLAVNRASDALPLFTALAEQNPRDPMLQDGLGQAYESMGDWVKAFAAYRKAIALNPRDSSYPLNMGLALMRSDPKGNIKGRRDLAIQYLREATKLNPQGAPAFLQLGLLLIDKKRWTEAQGALRSYVALKPNDTTGIFNLALSYDSSGTNFDEALKYYGQVELLEPNDAAVKNNIGRIYFKRKLYNDAIAQFRKALEIDDNSTDARTNLAIALAAKGDYTAANSEWRRLIALLTAQLGRPVPPATPQSLQASILTARAALAENLYTEKKYADSAREYRALLKQEPTNTDVMINLGLALYYQGDLAGAMTQFNAVIKREPNNAFAHNNRGIVLESQNRRADALASYKKAVELKPDFMEAKTNRDRLLAATVIS
jgi:tetratricopeptide (TPR) repeat protein